MSENTQLVLPYFTKLERIIPSSVARSALFGLFRRGDERKAYDDEVIASYGGTEIRYTGVTLNQQDLDTWMEVITLLSQERKNKVSTTGYRLLKGLGKATNKQNYEHLKRSLKRLSSATVEIKIPKKDQPKRRQRPSYFGPFIFEGAREDDEIDSDIMLVVNQKMVALFGQEDRYTKILVEIRRSLRSDLAKWLHSYICSHKATTGKPHYIKLTKLQELTGSSSKKWEFKRMLKRALEELTKQHVIVSSEITDDELVIMAREVDYL